jgi:hypothetical protein
LLDAITIDGPVWEPCAGKGAISRVLRANGFKVIENDLVAFRKITKANFLDATRAKASTIITNPPYKHATRFIEHARYLNVEFLALLLSAHFLNTELRYKLVQSVGYPTHIYGLVKRPDFTGEGSPPMVCSWFVWERWGARSSKFRLLDNRSRERVASR